MTQTPAAELLRSAAARARQLGDPLHLALATLLDAVMSNCREADHEECQRGCSPETCDLSAALAVARQILGTTGDAPKCGKTISVDGQAHPPCVLDADHSEAYCRDSSGNEYFIATHDARQILGTTEQPEPPLSPYYSHEACGFHWHGRDGMDIPMRDGQPICPRCELAAKVQQPAVVQPAPVVDRAAVLDEAIRRVEDPAERAKTTVGLGLGWESARDVLRRMADEAQPETEAHPAEHTWAAELYDPLADEWVPGTRYVVRDRAVNALEHARKIAPNWKDGTPTDRRLVRATTTYTVEPAPAVTEEPK